MFTMCLRLLFTITSLLFCAPTLCSANTRCSSFNKVQMTFHRHSGKPFQQKISGCVERISFDNITITELYVKDQRVPRLGVDSIRNLVRLHTISFQHCPIRTLEEGAFRNVPSLKTLRISNSSINELKRGVFQVGLLEYLRLDNNKIDVIEDRAFGSLSSLRRLNCSNNLLEYWNREWLSNSSNVQVLDFQFNRIRTLPRGAFLGLTKLQEINFNYNEIATIHRDAFKGLQTLESLGLRYNRLKIVEADVFPRDFRIMSLLIDANYLNFLALDVLKRIEVKYLTVDGNPWKCECLERISQWLQRNNGTTKASSACRGGSVPVCSHAEDDSGNCIEEINDTVTEVYFNKLQALNFSLDKYCARLDE